MRPYFHNLLVALCLEATYTYTVLERCRRQSHRDTIGTPWQRERWLNRRLLDSFEDCWAAAIWGVVVNSGELRQIIKRGHRG